MGFESELLSVKSYLADGLGMSERAIQGRRAAEMDKVQEAGNFQVAEGGAFG